MEQLYKTSARMFEEVEVEYAAILNRLRQENPERPVSLKELKKLFDKINEAGFNVYVLEHRTKLRLMFNFIHNKILFAGVHNKDIPSQIREMRIPGRLTSLSEL